MRAIVISLCVLFAGCGAPSIDTSSDESMKQSIEKVRQSLPEAKRKDFDEAVSTMMLSNINMESVMAGAAARANMEARIKESINGKTGEQIIDEATHIRAEREERERQEAAERAERERQEAAERAEQEKQEALKEIAELKAQKVEWEVAREELSKFEVTRSRFYKQKQQFMGKQPVIELSVKNGTSRAVARACFEGTLASPGRSVPWLKDSFAYEISGGLESGEEATWKLAPNMFSEWGEVEAPADAVLTVTVQRLEGASGEPLYTLEGFGEDKAVRLRELCAKYAPEDVPTDQPQGSLEAATEPATEPAKADNSAS